MKKSWEHSLLVQAPVESVFELVADFNRHVEWDRYTKRVELVKAGDERGVGAEWKVYEQLGLFSLGEEEQEPRHSVGLAKRTVREVTPSSKVVWHTHSVPNVGISAEISVEFWAEAEGTRVTETVVVSVPGVLEKMGRLIVRNLDKRAQGQWTASLEELKALAERQVAAVPEAIPA